MMPRTLPPPTLPDADLVRRFVRDRDEAAFELLVWRYRGLVADVCCRALGHAHDAEDAAQAAFLVLARCVSSVRGETLAAWLARVAYRCALRVRRTRKPFAPLPDIPTAPLADPLDAHLDAELDKLPEKYRRPLVLCYLHGLSYAEASAELDCPTGTLCGWLTRGKELLRKRLARRGVAVPGGVFAAHLGTLGAGASAHHQVRSVTTAAVAFALGERPPGPAATIAHGVLAMTGLNRVLLSAACGLAVLLATTAVMMAADPPKTPDEPKAVAKAEPKTDAERLNGTWVFDEYRMGRGSGLAQVWFSVVTVADGKFSISKVYGAKAAFTGSVTVDEAKKGIDFKLDGFDLSPEGMPLKLSPCTVPALYKLDGDTLTLALEFNTEGKRPAEIKAAGKRDAVLVLKRAPKDFKALPAELTVKVVGPDDKPASGAVVGGYMHHTKKFELTDKEGKPIVIDLTKMTAKELEKEIEKLPEDKSLREYVRGTLTPPPGTVRDPDTGWTMHYAQTAAADGTVKVKMTEEDFQTATVIARDPAKKLIGITSLSPWRILGGEVTVKLQPECRVTVAGTCAEIAKSGAKVDDHFNSYMQTADGERIAFFGARDGKLEYLLPPGGYSLYVYGSEAMGDKVVELTVPKDQSEYAAPPIDLPATGLHKLVGKQAPELTDVVGWKGEAVKLADLKGKVVLLEFWGYWCGPCIGSMPVLFDLHDKFKDDVVIVGVHIDGDGEVTTAKELDEKLTKYKKDVWKDRDLPFPTALASGKGTESGARGKLADLYGIRGYPSTVLIDRDGKVVGKFHARDTKTAIAAMERVLKGEKK